MSHFTSLDRRIAITSGVIGFGAGAAGYMLYKILTGKCKCKWMSCGKKSNEDVYESQKSLNEYLIFHYGSSVEILSYDFGPVDSLHFPKRCADLCAKYKPTTVNIPSRVLDIGCAVGRSTFELTESFDEAVGIDYSQSFINMCNTLKEKGEIQYSVTTVGDLTKELQACVDKKLDRNKASFQQGDACKLSRELGQFGCILAANLICRLQTPKTFFDSLKYLTAPGGIVIITSPYTFLREFTPSENWIGGFYGKNGEPLTGFDGMKILMKDAFDFIADENLPFFIRETERKNQWTVAHATIWKRKTY